jgi:imidazolonepropionase
VSTAASSWILTDIGELCTLENLVAEQRATGITADDLTQKKNAWLAAQNGKVIASGSGPVPSTYDGWRAVSARGGLVLPGFVDSHTHPIFAGSRTNEFLLRMSGASYQDIAAAGGGIASSMKATRAASDEELGQDTLGRLETFLRHGVTTVECKSGYGLSVVEELRLLRVLSGCRQRTPQQLSITCLALHAKSPEIPDKKAYADACARDLLPLLSREGLADGVDAFIEDGYFSVDEVRGFFQTARDLGFAVRVHADEFTDAGGGAFAAEVQAASADHLQYVSDDGLKRMAAAGVTATILPGTSLYTNIPFTNGRRIMAAGVPLAIATDFNPGSCVIDNISLIATVASIHCGVPPAAVLAGVTWVAARSLGLGARKGALAAGFDADLTVWSHKTFADWIADFGRQRPREVYIEGRPV